MPHSLPGPGEKWGWSGEFGAWGTTIVVAVHKSLGITWVIHGADGTARKATHLEAFLAGYFLLPETEPSRTRPTPSRSTPMTTEEAMSIELPDID